MMESAGITFRSFRFWKCKCSVNDLRLDRMTIFKLICTENSPDPLVYYVGFFKCISFSSGFFKTIKGYKVDKIIIISCSEFCRLVWLDKFFDLITIVIAFILGIFVIIFWSLLILCDEVYFVAIQFDKFTCGVTLCFQHSNKFSFYEIFSWAYIFDSLQKSIVL